MRGPTRWTLLAAAVLVAFAGTAHAAGFNIYEAGARATALGGAFTATADDGSALFYNASGMSFVEGMAVDINLMPITPGFKFAEANDGQRNAAVNTSFPIPGADRSRFSICCTVCPTAATNGCDGRASRGT